MAKCKKCEAEIEENIKFCPYCGEFVDNKVVTEEKSTNELVEQILLDNNDLDIQPSTETVAETIPVINQPLENIPTPVQPQEQVQPTPQPVVQQQQYYQPQQIQVVNSAIDIKTKTMGVFGYLVAMFLFSIPIIGLLTCIIWACGGAKNINRKNFARAFLIIFLIVFILAIATFIIGKIIIDTVWLEIQKYFTEQTGFVTDDFGSFKEIFDLFEVTIN